MALALILGIVPGAPGVAVDPLPITPDPHRLVILEPTPAPAPTLVTAPASWEATLECESSGDWAYNGPSGYDGGLQFDPGTWSGHAPEGYPAHAYEATPGQQVHVAELVLASHASDPWPNCPDPGD